MSVGTGLFLGSLIIGLVMLYGQTKDRWRWRRAVFMASLAAGFLILGAVGLVWRGDRQRTREVLDEVRQHRERHRVSIGDGVSRVRQRQGVPDTTVTFDDGTSAFGYWRHRHEGPSEIFLFTAEGVLVEIRFMGDGTRARAARWVPEDGVELGIDVDSVRTLLGTPCREEMTEQATNLEFELPDQSAIRWVAIGHGVRRVIRHGWREGGCQA